MTLKILVATGKLEEFAGSEIVAWEVAEHFAARGHAVTLFTRSHGLPLSELDGPFTITTDPNAIDLTSFDLVWSQHHMVLRVPEGLENCVRRRQLPKFVTVSLSPFEPAEHVDAIIVRALGAEVWANSVETAEFVSAVSRRIISIPRIHVFHNAAPDSFWAATSTPPSEQLQSLLVVSNHVPPEVLEAVAQLKSRGMHVRVVGAAHEPIRVDGAALAGADAVLTIGKTVVDAIAVGRPAFVYDHFGGDGWLNDDNFAQNLRHNFSGRPAGRRLEGAQIVEELLSGYAAASAFSRSQGANASGLRLSEHLDALLDRTPRHRRRWHAYLLGMHFASRNFRVHVATVRRLVAGWR